MSLEDDLPVGIGPVNTSVAGAAAEAGALASSARSEVRELAADVDRLFNVVQVLWQILQEAHGYDDATLRRRVAEVERARAARNEAHDAPRACVACGRQVSRRRSRCMYCHAVNPADPFAR